MMELAALGAALCWALTGVLSAAPAGAIGPFAFGLTRQLIVAATLTGIVVLTDRWGGVSRADVLPLAASGIVGIFLGDTIMFLTLVRLGPRRTGALFALNAPMAALLGWAVLGERLSPQAWAGVMLCAAGVAISVMGRPGRSGGHALERIRGRRGVGVALGLLAALGQATSSLISRPVMAGGADPITASAVRVTVAVAALAVLMALPIRGVKPWGNPGLRHVGQIALSGILGMVIGMTLMLYALSGAKVGIVSTLSALSPVIILPVLWLSTGSRPSRTSVLGALIAVAGIALIFLR